MDWKTTRKYLNECIRFGGPEDYALWNALLDKLEADPQTIFNAMGLYAASLDCEHLNSFFNGFVYGLSSVRVPNESVTVGTEKEEMH